MLTVISDCRFSLRAPCHGIALDLPAGAADDDEIEAELRPAIRVGQPVMRPRSQRTAM
jgi:hypothetical protein